MGSCDSCDDGGVWIVSASPWRPADETVKDKAPFLKEAPIDALVMTEFSEGPCRGQSRPACPTRTSAEPVLEGIRPEFPATAGTAVDDLCGLVAALQRRQRAELLNYMGETLRHQDHKVRSLMIGQLRGDLSPLEAAAAIAASSSSDPTEGRRSVAVEPEAQLHASMRGPLPAAAGHAAPLVPAAPAKEGGPAPRGAHRHSSTPSGSNPAGWCRAFTKDFGAGQDGVLQAPPSGRARLSLGPLSPDNDAATLSRATNCSAKTTSILPKRRLSPSAIDRSRRTEAYAKSSVTHELMEQNIGPYTPTFHDSLTIFIESRNFHLFVFFAILSNVLVVGLETEMVAKYGPEDVSPVFERVSHVYTLAFTVEVVMRVAVHGLYFFYCRDWAWNWFDFSVVVASVLESMLAILTSISGAEMKDSQVFRVIRVVRLTRMFRMVRLVKFVQALRTMVLSIIVTMKSLIWALMLLVMIFYGFAIAFTQAVANYTQTVAAEKLEAPEMCGEADITLFWGSVPKSMFTLFKAMTGGISWHVVVQPLSNVSWFSVALFNVYVVFTILAVANVITGAFCQSAVQSAKSDKELATMELVANRDKFLADLERLFLAIDRDRSGTIDLQEFESHLADGQLQVYFALLEIDIADAWTLFKLLDEDQSGIIDIRKFADGCMELRGQAKAIQIAKLSQEHAQFRRQVGEAMNLVINQVSALSGWAGLEITDDNQCLPDTLSENGDVRKITLVNGVGEAHPEGERANGCRKDS